MDIYTDINSMKQHICELHQNQRVVGFVPTMGALHEGHLALVRKALIENDHVICSIFVNPIQFNNPTDLEKYPRTWEKDIEMLQQIGCHTVFHPTVEQMYPHPENKKYDFGLLDKVMEGRFRPGHFNGVAIVVKKFFDIIQPHKAYFGQKDYQQLAIIKALVEQEKMAVQIIPCPTMREPDGLAMSSRNMRLKKEHREIAPIIYRTLKKVGELYSQIPNDEIKKWVISSFNNLPEITVEYFELADAETLEPIFENKPNGKVVACIAVCFGEVRLIDNVVFNL